MEQVLNIEYATVEVGFDQSALAHETIRIGKKSHGFLLASQQMLSMGSHSVVCIWPMMMNSLLKIG
ncbi:hypothetical protein [Thaumasiovibrio sp. DFM-14]|uniref:hypothetical protein n=1 Tax=Thaumasiovibrio sp. DFM-14 TaxID=3384792 RepID=UPI00399F6A7A